jgi:hypothetical protein
MTKRKLSLLGAAMAGALFAASAGANDMNRGAHRGDRVLVPTAPTGAVVRDSTPTSPNESNPTLLREARDPVARSDNPNLPNPVTPSGANESAPQPRTTVYDPTNQPGIARPPVGATR